MQRLSCVFVNLNKTVSLLFARKLTFNYSLIT